MTTASIWLLAGVLLALAEVHFAGFGLFFAGLGAIAAGSAVYAGILPPEDSIAQFVLFFAASIAFAALLWKPLKKFRLGKQSYSNIVGETAYAGSNGISKSTGGEATWSGTIMKAKLAKDATIDRLEAGTAVTVVEVQGATLIVKPSPPNGGDR